LRPADPSLYTSEVSYSTTVKKKSLAVLWLTRRGGASAEPPPD